MPRQRSEKYYYETVVFEVEERIYRVCRYGFVNWSQSIFCDMFSLPQPEEDKREGDRDENPIKLSGCTKEEFESLLELMYPSEGPGIPIFSKEQWTNILKLARLWDMPKPARIAISKLNELSLTPIEMVTLGKAYAVPEWLKEGYTTLIEDVHGSPLERLMTLGMEIACRILWAQNQVHIRRESIGSTRYCGRCIHPPSGGRPRLRVAALLNGQYYCDYCEIDPTGNEEYGLYG
ncbi:hypothetical protein FA13DRAFT_1737344 [Coprinellus micaceus]|uniref:BTB domain-containing protein n=1 Tax=Coprinellus micaceus TaxID=71717 RepID=A0A4Y7SXR7_COPMI|nr:hypothetical protein FA13DRAFT_1737344 [Coprinellus micaceus]